MLAIRTLLARLAAGQTIGGRGAGVYGASLGELETQWRRNLGG